MNIDESKPAPSLDELPPEKGTILELHSIGRDDWDGKLVEFHRAEKDTGKLYVRFYRPKEGDDDKDDGGGIRVKAKCCRRPELKSLKFRFVLAKLASKLSKDADKCSPFVEQKLLDILEKDPCCCTAHFALAGRDRILMYQSKEDPEENWAKSAGHRLRAIGHYQRALATLYAYRQWIPDKNIKDAKEFLLVTLVAGGHNRSALRYAHDEKVLYAATDMFEEYASGEKYLKSAIKASKEVQNQHDLLQTFNKMKKAVHHYCNCLAVVLRPNNGHGDDGVFQPGLSSKKKKSSECMGRVELLLDFCIAQFNDFLGKWCSENGLGEYSDNKKMAAFTLANRNDVIAWAECCAYIVDRVYDVCTDELGNVLLLPEALKKKLNEARGVAATQLENLKASRG